LFWLKANEEREISPEDSFSFNFSALAVLLELVLVLATKHFEHKKLRALDCNVKFLFS